jgi:hypothetical protein
VGKLAWGHVQWLVLLLGALTVVLYECETWSLILLVSVGHRLRMF